MEPLERKGKHVTARPSVFCSSNLFHTLHDSGQARLPGHRQHHPNPYEEVAVVVGEPTTRHGFRPLFIPSSGQPPLAISKIALCANPSRQMGSSGSGARNTPAQSDQVIYHVDENTKAYEKSRSSWFRRKVICHLIGRSIKISRSPYHNCSKDEDKPQQHMNAVFERFFVAQICRGCRANRVSRQESKTEESYGILNGSVILQFHLRDLFQTSDSKQRRNLRLLTSDDRQQTTGTEATPREIRCSFRGRLECGRSDLPNDMHWQQNSSHSHVTHDNHHLQIPMRFHCLVH